MWNGWRWQMTKLAIQRRQSIRAMRTLMRKWPNIYTSDRFEMADGQGDELAGTPIYWTRPYDGEADSRLASEELAELLWAESVDWGRVAKQDDIRARYPKHAAPDDGRCAERGK